MKERSTLIKVMQHKFNKDEKLILLYVPNNKKVTYFLSKKCGISEQGLRARKKKLLNKLRRNLKSGEFGVFTEVTSKKQKTFNKDKKSAIV